MRTWILTFIFAVTSFGSSMALADKAPVPKQLTEQIARLAALLSDGYAQGYAEASKFQILNEGQPNEVVLVVFTIEGFGGGNSFNQHLAVFSRNVDPNGMKYFSLLDVVPVGGKGWRQVQRLEAKVLPASQIGETRFSLPVTVNAENDAPNFPSTRGAVTFSLRKDRLTEVKGLAQKPRALKN